MRTTIYLPTAEGLYILRGSGESWRGHVALQGMQVQCVAQDAMTNGRVYAGTFGHGIRLSNDHGASWRASNGLQSAKVTALFASSTGALYAGTEPSAVYRSSDRGESWQPMASLMALPSAPTWSFPPRPETHHIQTILEDHERPGKLHVAVEAGALLATDDGGKHWKDRVAGGPLDTHTLVADPTQSQHLIAAAGDGCFESRDGGTSWQPAIDGLDQTYCWSVAVHPADPATVLLSSSAFAFTAHSPQQSQSFLYRRVANGPWQLAMDGLSILSQVRIPVIAASLLEPHTFYLAAESNVYRSADGGSHWEALNVQWDQAEAQRRHSLSIAISQEE